MYYFICYQWTREGMKDWEVANTVVSRHPTQWLKDCIDNFNDVYRITFFTEITKEQFELLDGEM